MHEFSVAGNLLELCLQNAEQNQAKQITKVTVKIGRLSGIEPHYLNFAFDVIKEETIARNAILQYFMQDLIIYCNECKKKASLDEINFTCPECKSNKVEVIDGDDLFLMDLELEV